MRTRGGCVVGPGENPMRPGEVAIRIKPGEKFTDFLDRLASGVDLDVIDHRGHPIVLDKSDPALHPTTLIDLMKGDK